VSIIDWKTGRSMSEDVSIQLSCYAVYVMEKWGVDPENVRLIEYNLLANQVWNLVSLVLRSKMLKLI
jgi:CRISPR/Cas system-associated exonuclease Cas4 (RecB family)